MSREEQRHTNGKGLLSVDRADQMNQSDNPGKEGAEPKYKSNKSAHKKTDKNGKEIDKHSSCLSQSYNASLREIKKSMSS